MPRGGPLDAIVLRCLAREPHERYASAKEVAADLERFLSGEPVLAAQRGRAPLAAALQRRPLAVAAIAGLAFFTLNYLIARHANSESRLSSFDRWVAVVVPGWALATIAFQEAVLRARRIQWLLIFWTLTNVAFLSALIQAGLGPTSAMVVALPLLVTATALRMSGRLVLLATVATMTAYSGIWLHAYLYRWEPMARVEHLTCTLAALVAAGVISALLVRQQRRLALVDRG